MFSSRLATSLLAGALGGVFAGLLDLGVSWGRIQQFVPGFFTRCLLATQVGALYGGAGALVAAFIVVAFAALVRFTHLGTLLGPASPLRSLRARGIGGAEARLALVVSWIVLAAPLLVLSVRMADTAIAARRNPTLIAAVVIALALLCIAAATLGSFALARLMDGPLRLLRTAALAEYLQRDSVATTIAVGMPLLPASWLAFHVPSPAQPVSGIIPVAFVVSWIVGSLGWIVARPSWRRTLALHRQWRAAGSASEGRHPIGHVWIALVVAVLLGVVLAALVEMQLGRMLIRRNQDSHVTSHFLMGLNLLLLWGILPFAILAARPIERLLLVCSPALVQQRMGHPAAPYIAGALIISLAAICAAIASRQILALLYLRPMTAAGLWTAGAVLFWMPAVILARRLAAWSRWAVRLAPLGLVAGLCVIGLSVANDMARFKAANAWTGLTRPILGSIRWAADRDGDGFASVLGGGDCDDRNTEINPLATDAPDDGTDQNCTGGDAKTPTPAEGRPVPLPMGVRADLNVLLITIDSVFADQLGCYGHKRATTPALDRLASQSVVFDHAWSHASFTRPSITSILTGRFVTQARFTATPDTMALATDNGTLGGIMKAAGAVTGAIVSCPSCLTPAQGFAHGFDDYDVSTSALQPGGSKAPDSPESSAREQADLAIEWMARHADKRFFLWVHFLDPHPPFRHHAGTPEFGDDNIAMGDHELRYTDEHVGRMLAWIGASALAATTATFVTSDHGNDFGLTHGIPPGSLHLYPTHTRVPLIVHVPGIPAGRARDPVCHVDILPTIAQLAGIGIPLPLPGSSLIPLALAPPGATQDRGIYQVISEPVDQRRAVIHGCKLLIHNLVPEATFEQYDLCSNWDTGFKDAYAPPRDGGLRSLLLELEDRYQVVLPAWTPSRFHDSPP